MTASKDERAGLGCVSESNVLDNPLDWIREETLADIRFDGASMNEALAIGCEVFEDACKAYQSAVFNECPRAAVTEGSAIQVTRAFQVDRSGMSETGAAQPATYAVANGPDWSLLLVHCNNRFEVLSVP